MILQRNNRINYSLFNPNLINSKIRNETFFKNFYFKINYVYQEPCLVTPICQGSNFIAKISKKKANKIVAYYGIKNKILIPHSNKNFKVYFLFIIFYFDEIRSNILSTSLLYNYFLKPFKVLINKEIRKSDKPFPGYINQRLHFNQHKKEESKGDYNEKKEKDYRNISILKKSGNDIRPIHFFKSLKKSTAFMRRSENKSFAFPTFKTFYKSTHNSFYSERFSKFSYFFIYQNFKLIKFLTSATLLRNFLFFEQSSGLACPAEQEKDMRIKLYKKSLINFDLNFYKIIIKNILDSEISFNKILYKYSLILFNIFLKNLIESHLNSNRNFFQYKNKFEKVKFESSTNQLIWYFKIKQTKVIYIFKEVLTFLNSSEQGIWVARKEKNNIRENAFLKSFFSSYYYLNILIIKQDKNLPYSLKLIYLNLHYRIFCLFKLFLTYFFSFLFHFNSRIFNPDAFFIFKIKLIKIYNLNSQKQISSIIQKPSKKSRIFKIKKYLNQGLWQLNKKDHNQNPLKWIFKKYWSNINYSLIISNNLTVYYYFKSNNINLLKIFFNKKLLTKKMDSNLIPKTFLFESNNLKNYKIRYKLYQRKIVLKNLYFLNLNLQKKIINLIQLDSYIILLDQKKVKLSYFFNIQFFNLVKSNRPIRKIKTQPVILFNK